MKNLTIYYHSREGKGEGKEEFLNLSLVFELVIPSIVEFFNFINLTKRGPRKRKMLRKAESTRIP